MTFAAAMRRLPRCCAGGFDPGSHKTVADLRALVQHEIDLHDEGDETEIATAADLRACARFLREVQA